MRALALSTLLVAGTARADILLHAEVDPLTFANRGYGAQVGARFDHLRFALASFSLHVPDVVSQIGNAKFDERVQPSGALYALYYPHRDGFAFGGSLRFLRIAYQHDNEPGMVHVTELSPEAIVAYQWRPFHNGFYLQPWLALGVTLWRDHAAVLNGHTYDELPVSPFFTVNIGWDQQIR